MFLYRRKTGRKLFKKNVISVWEKNPRKMYPESSAHKEKTKCPKRVMWVLPLEDYYLKIVILKDQMDIYGLHYSRKQVQNHV